MFPSLSKIFYCFFSNSRLKLLYQQKNDISNLLNHITVVGIIKTNLQERFIELDKSNKDFEKYNKFIVDLETLRNNLIKIHFEASKINAQMIYDLEREEQLDDYVKKINFSIKKVKENIESIQKNYVN